MNPKTDNQDPSSGPDVTVEIPHGQSHKQERPVSISAPSLPKIEPLPIRPINITNNITPPPITPVAPPILPSSLDEFHEHKERRWPIILTYTVLAFLVAVGVVFAGRWVYRKTTHHAAKTTQPETPGGVSLPAAPPTGNQQPSSGGTTSSSASGAGQGQTASQLPNNGPGDVAAIFVDTALITGGLHFIYKLRRQS